MNVDNNQANQKAKEKARIKREEQRRAKVYKTTNVEYQKHINATRSDYGLEKKPIQKPLSTFFKPA